MALVLAAAGCGGEADAGSGAGSAPARGAAHADTGGAQSGAASSSRRGARTVLFVGTSLTAGYGLPPDAAYPTLIQERIDSLGLNYHVVNAGVSGETSADARRRIGWLLRGDPADILVLETGANDGLRGLSTATLRANIEAIVDSVRAILPQATILLVAMEAPPNLGRQYTAAFQDVYRNVAARKHVVLVPFLLNGVAGDPSLNQGDGIHPNVRGERIVAENVWRSLRGYVEAGGLSPQE